MRFYIGKLKQIIFITGADTGVGKTVFTGLLVSYLRKRGLNAAALKPICSGGRDDAKKIFRAMNGALSLDEINPWHFRAPIAPSLAARLEQREVKLPQLVAHIRKMQKHFDVLLVEGAGGLLSPLGGNFDSRDLILKLRAKPIVVAQNKLGVVNHLRLTLEALPDAARRKAKIVLMTPAKADSSTKTNRQLLTEFVEVKVILLPHFRSISKVFGKPFAGGDLAALIAEII
ncbi:MAG TPA: dethiobiotin synthase [Verrucomicrobiae bacterium]|nr:dethiobiotin synthase [Verrucomicrobiae bacterium]